VNFVDQLNAIDDSYDRTNTLIAEIYNVGKWPWQRANADDVSCVRSMLKSTPNHLTVSTPRGINVQQIIQAIKVFCKVDEGIAQICEVVFPKD